VDKAKYLSKTLPNIKNEEILHVFLIVNPVALFVSKMIIDDNNIKDTNLLIISLRNTDVSLISKVFIKPNESYLNRLLIKFFSDTPISRDIIKKIHSKNKKFILYTSWSYHESISTPSIDKILTSNLCQGHFYLEEGQASYRKSKPYSANTIYRDKPKHAENLKNTYRDDALGYIGILSDVFPDAPCDKRIIISNFADLIKAYKPKLLGVETIGLSCAERRLRKDQWESMLSKLIKNMPNGGVIKLHPSFTSTSTKRKKIVSIFNRIAPDSITLCSDNAIIEIEMLYETKVLIGSLTSLNKYADAFRSKFINLDLY
tara:strand:+ start:639 stop:1586 length:948 start_codon:yes stop_codon:yes gene_type:complete